MKNHAFSHFERPKNTYSHSEFSQGAPGATGGVGPPGLKGSEVNSFVEVSALSRSIKLIKSNACLLLFTVLFVCRMQGDKGPTGPRGRRGPSVSVSTHP